MARKGNCYGVVAQYPLECEGPTVCVRGKIDLAATDEKIMRIARRAVPRIPQYVDSGAGPFCGPGYKGPPCKPMRDLEIDTISLTKGLTHAEMKKLTRALDKAGVPYYLKRDACHISQKPG